MVATASIKMDELLATWLGSDTIYENVLRIIETQKAESSSAAAGNAAAVGKDGATPPPPGAGAGNRPPLSPKVSCPSKALKKKLEIPPFFRIPDKGGKLNNNNNANSTSEENPQLPPQPPKRRLSSSFSSDQTWDGIYSALGNTNLDTNSEDNKNIQERDDDRDSVATDRTDPTAATGQATKPCIAIQAQNLFLELGILPELVSSSSDVNLNPANPAHVRQILSNHFQNDIYHQTHQDMRYIPLERFEKITKELCNFPTFSHKPLYERILLLWENYLKSENFFNDLREYNANPDAFTNSKSSAMIIGGQPQQQQPKPPIKLKGRILTTPPPVITFGMFHYFWSTEMAPYDMNERFFRLLKQPDKEYISRDDFFPYIKELLNDHPGLEFLSNHAEFQDKYAVTVITRIFYSVNLCHSGRITSRQIRKSNLLSVFQQVDEEEDINKVTKYFSYEHFYVLYCRFWELDNDRDYRITREDLLKYGEHSLSHMIVDRIFDAAPRPFEGNDPATLDENGNAVPKVSREFLSYEDFIFFMLSEEDKANEFSVRYWFQCVDVDGDDKLNNMEMRSFYAVQLHRMQCMGHEVVPFEDMLCQMMDMIKPANAEHLVVEDFLQPHCSQVSGALYDALFNVNKYVMFEQRDPFLERQKREDEFETDWDRFACIDYNRLAMEEEAREEEAMEIDWVTGDEEEEDGDEYNSLGLSGSSEAPF